MGFAINPPNAALVDPNGMITPEWYRFFSQLQKILGDDVVTQIQSANFLTYSSSPILTNQRRLLAGTALTITIGASTATLDLDNTAVAPASYGSDSQVASFTVDQQGRLTNAANVTITPAAIGAVPIGTTITAGAGLTGGGDLSTNRTFDVGAGTGITVNANDVALNTSNTRNTDHASVTLTAGAGLTGGGDITANRTFDIGAGTGITVNANDVAITATGVSAASYGSATKIPNITFNAQGQATAASESTIPVLDSGNYTPTVTAVANSGGLTAYESHWMRVGDIVTGSGKVDVTPTAAGVSTVVGISLPVASAFTAATDADGVTATASLEQGGGLEADATNDRMQIRYIAGDTVNRGMFYSYSYKVI